MAKLKNPFSRVRLVFRRSKPLTKMIVAIAIVLSMVALISLGVATRAAKERAAELQQQVGALEQENEALQQDISKLGTIESLQKLARELLDLVVLGTVFFNTGE